MGGKLAFKYTPAILKLSIREALNLLFLFPGNICAHTGKRRRRRMGEREEEEDLQKKEEKGEEDKEKKDKEKKGKMKWRRGGGRGREGPSV